ncbi:hypothetical protein [Sphaerisporangium sp. NPDC051011]|uniref:hypothetical protein n=1 Tax=Sphaerisporangium sp. NPDC051011 TaxID=3155792 RepID=UPI0033E64E39
MMVSYGGWKFRPVLAEKPLPGDLSPERLSSPVAASREPPLSHHHRRPLAWIGQAPPMPRLLSLVVGANLAKRAEGCRDHRHYTSEMPPIHLHFRIGDREIIDRHGLTRDQRQQGMARHSDGIGEPAQRVEP